MIAYDEAEQELYGDSPVMSIPISRVHGAKKGSPLHLDGSNVMVKGDGLDDSNSPVQLHEEVSPLEPNSFMFEGDDWGVEKLLGEPVYVYAKIMQSPSWTDGAESGVSTGVEQSMMPAIQVEAYLDDILPKIW